MTHAQVLLCNKCATSGCGLFAGEKSSQEILGIIDYMGGFLDLWILAIRNASFL